MFLHPWMMAIGAVAAALPVAIHFLTRPRPVRMPLSTLRFVQDAVRQRRARHRLRDVIVLTLRTLALLALAATIARPDFGRKETVAVDDQARLVRVVIADVSQSMAAVHQGVRLFERGRPMIARRLENGSGARSNLILAAARPVAVFERASSNLSILHEALAAAHPLPEQCHVQAALNQAVEVLAREGDDSGLRREVVIISDFQRSNWVAADFSVFPQEVEIILESVAPAEPLPNVGLLRVAGQERPEAGRLARLEVDVGNFSPTPQNVRVDVTIGGMSVQLTGLCAPHGRTTLTGELVPRDIGWQIGEARLVGVEDALPDDDVRPCVLDVRPPPRFALVTRQSEKSRPSSSYFLERALVPLEGSGPQRAGVESGSEPVRVTRIDPTQLDLESLATFDLVVIDHPGKLSSEALSLLAALLRRGRGLLYVSAEAQDATNLKLLSNAVGPGWKLPVEFLPPRSAHPRRNLFLAEVRREESPFSIFGDEIDPLVSPLRFSGGLETRPAEGGLAEEVLAKFNDGSACLVSSSIDAGAVVILNADLGSSNLLSSAAFVPLVGELVQRLLLRGTGVADVPSGEPFAVSLPPISAVNELELVGAEPGSSVAGELVPEAGGILWRSEMAGPPGSYRVRHRNETVFALATAIPAAESDLRALSGEVFEERLAGGRNVRFHSIAGSTADERDTWWTWLAVACVVCALGEVTVMKLFPV
ncbi:MAG: hypothetical protein EXS05_22925 [Planctomycetaceae bacterium]|nr:hypothetical protein [Planctomycetaceae bacterium]